MDKICDSKINDNVISGLYNLLKTEHDNAEVICPQVGFFVMFSMICNMYFNRLIKTKRPDKYKSEYCII